MYTVPCTLRQWVGRGGISASCRAIAWSASGWARPTVWWLLPFPFVYPCARLTQVELTQLHVTTHVGRSVGAKWLLHTHTHGGGGGGWGGGGGGGGTLRTTSTMGPVSPGEAFHWAGPAPGGSNWQGCVAPHRSFSDTLVVLFRTTFWEEAALIVADWVYCSNLQVNGTENTTENKQKHFFY